MSIRRAPLSRRRRASDGLMVGSDMMSSSTFLYFPLLSSTFPTALRLDGPAKQPVQRGEELLDARIRDAVPERLTFAPEGDEALLAHPCEVLRQGRLRQTHGFGEGVHVALAPFDELAQDHQPALVGERAQNLGDLNRLFLKSLWIEGSGGHWSLRLL